MFEVKNGPIFIHLDITGACNLRCIHCRATSKPDKEELSLKDILQFLDRCSEFSNWKNLFIGGGEPLLRKKDVFAIFSKCKELGKKCYVNTNATLVDEDVAKQFAKNVEIVQVSLDGATEETHEKIRTVKGSFRDAMRGIELLKKYKNRIYIRMTLNNLNFHEAFELVDLGIKKGVEAVSFYRTLPVGRAKEKNIHIDKRLYYVILKELMRRRYELKDKIDIVSSDPLKVIMCERLKQEILGKYDLKNSMGGCLPGIAEVFINNIGNVYPCTMQPVLIGNIRKNDIVKLWLDSDYFNKLRDRNNLKGLCRKCELREACGGCRAAAFGAFGDYFETDPYCPKSFDVIDTSKLDNNKNVKTDTMPCRSC